MSRVRIHGAELVLGVLLALTLWTYVSFTTNPNATKEVTTPVVPSNLDPALIIVNAATGRPEPISASTTLTIVGPDKEIDLLEGRHFSATVDLAGRGPGVHQVPIEVEPRPYVRVRSLFPDELAVSLARELVKTVPISVTRIGQPPFSFAVGPVTQGAREATVRGPEELVARVDAAVARINLQGHTADISETIPLQAVDASGNPVDGVNLAPEGVSVHVPIAPQVAVQQVSVVPNLVGQPAPGYAVTSINWDPKVIEVFTSSAITGTVHTAPISLTGETESITRTVELERLSNVITRPPDERITVRVTIEPIGVPAQLPLWVEVSPVNIGAGLEASAEPTAVQLTIAGPFEQLNRLPTEELSATVNLAGMGVGTFSLPVSLDLPPGLRIVAPADPRVSVTITSVPTVTPEGATATPAPAVTTPTP